MVKKVTPAVEWMSVADVAKRLGVSERRVRALKNDIGYVRHGGALWFDGAAVAAFAQIPRVPGRPPESFARPPKTARRPAPKRKKPK